MATIFLLLHGYGGTHSEHWQGYLANHLKDKGQTVFFPDLPNADEPRLEEWMDYLGQELKDVDLSNLVVLAHSLGCTLWLQYVSRHPDIRPKKVFLVKSFQKKLIFTLTLDFMLPEVVKDY